ncbi:MAG TPA: LuxR C-terminal-related transcriptional regulator [Micromonospora sp.]
MSDLIPRMPAGPGRATQQMLTRIAAEMVPDLVREATGRADGRALVVKLACGSDADRQDLLLADLIQTGMTGSDDVLHMLHHRAAVADRERRRRLNRLAARGAEVRLLRDRPPGMITIGTDLALLRTTQGADSTPQSWLVRGAEAVGMLCRLHSALWEQAADLAPFTRGISGIVLDPAHSQVLTQLCSGVKDETAARQMNISVRTYRRHVATIMRNLKVGSRFEAGLKVAELGLVQMCRPDRVDAG